MTRIVFCEFFASRNPIAPTTTSARTASASNSAIRFEILNFMMITNQKYRFSPELQSKKQGNLNFWLPCSTRHALQKSLNWKECYGLSVFS
jgi:hypothetical protein